MNQHVDFIIPECYIDTNLVETLVCHGGCNHQKGCNQVAKIMQEKYADRFAVGIIDADKRQPSYINEFNKIASSSHLDLLRHRVRPHYIIRVQPAADGFILSCVHSTQIDITEYGLSPVLKDFTSQTKNVMSNKDPRFKRLFKALKNEGEFMLLQSLLDYLVDKTYNSSDSELATIFQTYQETTF